LTVANGNLDLGQTLPGIHFHHQGLEGRNKVGDGRRQDGTGVHYRDKTAALFMEAHQCAAFFLDKAHGKPRPVTVAPGGTGNGRIKDLRLQLGDVPESIFHDPLFDRSLGAGVQVLQTATAAGTEMRALWLNPQAGWLEYLGGKGLLVTGFAVKTAVFHPFAGKGVFDENDFAVDVGDATSFVVKGFDQDGGLAGNDARFLGTHGSRTKAEGKP